MKNKIISKLLKVIIPTILINIAIFCPLIVLHELGHAITAAIYGVPIESFNIGFGPKLFEFVVLGVQCNVRIILLGGYVSLPSIASFPLSIQFLILVNGAVSTIMLGVALLLLVKKNSQKVWEYSKLIVKTMAGGLIELLNVVSVSIQLIKLLKNKNYFFQKSEQKESIPLSYVPDLFLSQEHRPEKPVMGILYLIGIIAVGFGISNLLPIPIMDGGRIMLIAITSLTNQTYADDTMTSYLIWFFRIAGIRIFLVSIVNMISDKRYSKKLLLFIDKLREYSDQETGFLYDCIKDEFSGCTHEDYYTKYFNVESRLNDLIKAYAEKNYGIVLDEETIFVFEKIYLSTEFFEVLYERVFIKNHFAHIALDNN